ncbi:metalloprotease [Chryseobacterium sp. T16E-39]|uniref:T9SS-dependent M36 family metallopeptidase n=1 Tax=Chryseobacterium sp. T16E-39 TaxID=2015076 RepID=UPI000B5B3C46|nr:T9SS-dependent M36 family metallopeptidase [Chryseobacterium sp. T16E-39]ASK30937.1 metalloprotease [Chryseobacterium sp. T16E-39]
MIRIKFTIKFLLLSSLACFGSLSAQKYERIIGGYMNSAKGPLQKVSSELKAFQIINVDPSKSLKGDVVGIQQTLNGIPVFGSSANVLVRGNEVLSFADTFIKDYPTNIKGKENANKDLMIDEAVKKINKNASSKDSKALQNPIKATTVYYSKAGTLQLGYQFFIEEKGTSNVWNVIISTEDGSILYKENTTVSCDFHSDAYEHLPLEISQTNETAQPYLLPANLKKTAANFVFAPDDASYKVLAFPIEGPTFGNRTLISNPWDLTASPEGWHSDGTNHYTITRGNNTYTYTDENNTNTPQFSPDGGASRVFDFPMDVTLPPQNYTSAAVTNLFYTTNKMHDVFYKFGFTESARNFQMNNFTNGGTGNDPVLAEARDGGSYNNANFNPAVEGTSGRMQMYLFEPKDMQNLFYNAPANYTTRIPKSATAAFGPELEGNPPVTGDLALPVPANACTAIAAGTLTGKIAVTTAGGCAFALKTKNLQTAGAIGVIQYHPNSDTPVGLGGSDASITIPTIMIGKSEGEFLVNQLTAGTTVNGTLKYDKQNYIYKDGSLDNGVVAHEYGHGISNRLTGTGSSCLSWIDDNEQMGEGWSDFFALMVTNRPGDNASVPRGMGTFTKGQQINEAGIRPAKYSPDFSINNFTYARTNGMKVNDVLGGAYPVTRPDVHSIGFIWATMLWDLNWNYVEKYGYNSNVLADPNSGSAKVLQLVMDALKLQPCNPSFIQGRDAILAADQATTGGVDKCMIWKTFAKRGLGVNASPGGLNGLYMGFNDPAAELNDQVEDFTIPTECNTLGTKETITSSNSGISIYPNPVKDEFSIKVPSNNDLSGITTVAIYDLTGKLVSTEYINLNQQQKVNVSKLINGAYMVKITNKTINFSQKIIVSK